MPEPTEPPSFWIRSSRSIDVWFVQGGGVHWRFGLVIGTTIGATKRAAAGSPARAPALAPTCTELSPKIFAKNVGAGRAAATRIVSLAPTALEMLTSLGVSVTPFLPA